PVPTIDHAVSTFPMPTGHGVPALFMFRSQIAILPLVSRHSQSCLPSPLKSRCPTIDQVVGTAPNAFDDVTVAPFISHAATLPAVSRQAISLLLSPLKSWESMVVSDKRPILLLIFSVNHSAPSGPVVTAEAELVGIGKSVNTPSVVIRHIGRATESVNHSA